MKMMALESLEADPVAITATWDRIRDTRLVSQADVNPFIQHFPMNVSLNNFSEQPSSKGIEIAMEGFAALFKVAAGVALVGVLGACIYNFIRGRNAAETVVNSAAAVQGLSKSMTTLADGIRASSAWQSRSGSTIPASSIPMGVGGQSMNFAGDVSFLEYADKFYNEHNNFDMLVDNKALAVLIARGKFNSVTDNLVRPVAEYLGDLAKRVKQLQEIISKMPHGINGGDLNGAVDELDKVNLHIPRGTVLNRLVQVYDSVLTSPKGKFEPGSAWLLEDRVQALSVSFEDCNKKTGLEEAVLKSVYGDWCNGDFEKVTGKIPEICANAATISSAPSASVGKNIISECEELKRRVATSEFPEAVDKRFKEILEEIRLDSISALVVFDLAAIEQRQLVAYMRRIVLKTSQLAGAVSAFSMSADPVHSKRLAHNAVEAGKAALKIKI